MCAVVSLDNRDVLEIFNVDGNEPFLREAGSRPTTVVSLYKVLVWFTTGGNFSPTYQKSLNEICHKKKFDTHIKTSFYYLILSKIIERI